MMKDTIRYDGKTYIQNWFDYFPINLKITQVTGFVFKDNSILIVKNKEKDEWSFPGGHPEIEEINPIDTLRREIIEEASVEIQDIQYLGFVKVKDIQNTTSFGQLRYLARISKINDFNLNHEIGERKFVNIQDLSKYITWIDKGNIGKNLLKTFYKYSN